MIFDSALALKALREVVAGELVVVDWNDARGIALVIGATAAGVQLIPLSDALGTGAAMGAVLHEAQAGERCLSYGHDWVLRPLAPPAMIAFESDPGHGAGVVHLADAGPLLGFRPTPETGGPVQESPSADGPAGVATVAGYNLVSGTVVAAIAPPYASIFDWEIYPSARAAADPAAKALVSFRYKGME